MPGPLGIDLDDDVYSAIGEVLTDEEIELLVKQATGQDIYNIWASPTDARKIKVKKVIVDLKLRGNERWLLTYILIFAAAQERMLRQTQEKLRNKIVKAFPGTLVGLPQADMYVETTLNTLQTILNTPFPLPRKLQLRPKQPSFAAIIERIVKLFAYESLHESWLLLLITLSYNEALLSDPGTVDPNLESVARQIDAVANRSPAAIALLKDAGADHAAQVNQLTPLAVDIRNATGIQDVSARTTAATEIIDNVQRAARAALSRLNGDIFKTVRELTFESLMVDLPSDIEERPEFKELVQAMRDLTVTVLARTLKHKMWQDAENKLSLVGSYFESPTDAEVAAKDWFSLRDSVDWLAKLEPDQQWSSEAKLHTTEIDTEVYKEMGLDEAAKAHFHAYRKWFTGPFKRIDDALNADYGSLRKIDSALSKIVDALT